MAVQRPSDVGLLIPISTHAGGFWNLIPTGEFLLGLMKLVMKGHNDPRQKAQFAIGLHFTERFVSGMRDELMTRYLNGATDDYAPNNNNNNSNNAVNEQGVDNNSNNNNKGDEDNVNINMKTGEGDADTALRGHVHVVKSHSLARHEAAMIGNCERIYKVVLTGRSDCVIVSGASRKLGKAIKADVIVEVDGAHFIVEEAHPIVLANVKEALAKTYGNEGDVNEGDANGNGNANSNSIGAVDRKCDCSLCAPQGRKVRLSMDVFRAC